ncbi:MAG TPA: biotin/lipoyl-binding protein [Spirochaetales bacterium]|nr:biotin/lipoyl-binding protein [Spirochaetales bacterium]HPS14940.1 biotin/lipoyl-binding protein [Spirochaetales bacterium]
MKRYRITVDGQTYDVTVEETQGEPSAARSQASSQGAGTAHAPIPTQQAVRTVAANASASQEGQASAPLAPSTKKNTLTIKAPMPGVVMSFKVVAGQTVKKGDVVLILEAMKMENEIVSPQDGTVLTLHVPEGASVNTGDSLIDLG